jgi:hypothetical protein
VIVSGKELEFGTGRAEAATGSSAGSYSPNQRMLQERRRRRAALLLLCGRVGSFGSLVVVLIFWVGGALVTPLPPSRTEYH